MGEPLVRHDENGAVGDSADQEAAQGANGGTVWRPSRLARQLALAFKVEEMIDRGEFRSYSDAAKRLGITRARMSQIMRLRWLPVATQEAILLGELHASERSLRGRTA